MNGLKILMVKEFCKARKLFQYYLSGVKYFYQFCNSFKFYEEYLLFYGKGIRRGRPRDNLWKII